MLYYEFKLKGEKPFKVPSPRTKDYEEWINTVRNNIEDQNRKQDQKVRFFVVEAKSTYLKVFGFIGYKNNKDPKELAIEFARGIGFNAVEADGAEIKIHTFGQLARQADRNGFIDDDDRILNAGACFGRRIRNSKETVPRTRDRSEHLFTPPYSRIDTREYRQIDAVNRDRRHASIQQRLSQKSRFRREGQH